MLMKKGVSIILKGIPQTTKAFKIEQSIIPACSFDNISSLSQKLASDCVFALYAVFLKIHLHHLFLEQYTYIFFDLFFNVFTFMCQMDFQFINNSITPFTITCFAFGSKMFWMFEG